MSGPCVSLLLLPGKSAVSSLGTSRAASQCIQTLGSLVVDPEKLHRKWN